MRHRILVGAAAVLCAFGLAAQSVTLPPSGGNERQTIIQQIGTVKVTVDYSSPHVHSPSGQDRRGKIWGQLVPYGLVNLGFGTCKECPWRAGANENTTFTTSNDILVEGQKLAAGTYGVHMIPDPNEWTVIFSNNHTSWGSFTYDPAEDALRVKVKPEKSAYTEVLTYDFTERRNDHATLALRWEELAVPINITVPNSKDLYIAAIKNELRSSPGFTWQNWADAARYAIDNKYKAEAMQWAKAAAFGPQGLGNENFRTLMLVSEADELNGNAEEAKAMRDKALATPTATPLDIHLAGRAVLAKGDKEGALKIFQWNAKRFPKQWPVNVGLARGYSAVGQYDEALKYAKLAAAEAPDPGNKKNMEDAVKKLEAKQDIN
jgi:hypothetical protein